MAFIVEMVHGKPNRLEIMESDKDGELSVKNVIISGTPDPDFREFSCSGREWEKALELGRKMNWQPTGSVLEKTVDSAQPEISDYKPSSWGDEDYKVFMAKDAFALAQALRKGLDAVNEFESQQGNSYNPKLITSTMNENECRVVNQNLSKGFLAGFIDFLEKGEFIFVWDD